MEKFKMKITSQARNLFHRIFKIAVWLLLIPFFLFFLPAPSFAGSEYQEAQWTASGLPSAIHAQAMNQAIATSCQMPICVHPLLIALMQKSRAQLLAGAQGDEYEIRWINVAYNVQ